jgi:hypothetical protein
MQKPRNDVLVFPARPDRAMALLAGHLEAVAAQLAEGCGEAAAQAADLRRFAGVLRAQRPAWRWAPN